MSFINRKPKMRFLTLKFWGKRKPVWKAANICTVCVPGPAVCSPCLQSATVLWDSSPAACHHITFRRSLPTSALSSRERTADTPAFGCYPASQRSSCLNWYREESFQLFSSLCLEHHSVRAEINHYGPYLRSFVFESKKKSLTKFHWTVYVFLIYFYYFVSRLMDCWYCYECASCPGVCCCPF